MKKIIIILAIAALSACSYHTCPTYGLNDVPLEQELTFKKIENV